MGVLVVLALIALAVWVVVLVSKKNKDSIHSDNGVAYD
jgi:hypothetical protein